MSYWTVTRECEEWVKLVIELPRLFDYSCHHCLEKPVGDVGVFFPVTILVLWKQVWCARGGSDGEAAHSLANGLLVTNSTPPLHTFAPFTRLNPQIQIPLSKMNTHCSFSVHYRVTITSANKCLHSQGNGSAGGMMWSHQSNMSCIQLHIVKRLFRNYISFK